MAESFAEDGNYNLCGRKLILEWGKLKIEISKLPYGKDNPKDPLFDLVGSKVVLANILEGPDGHKVDEILGAPAGFKGDGTCLEGRKVGDYVSEDVFWMTPGEAKSGLKLQGGQQT